MIYLVLIATAIAIVSALVILVGSIAEMFRSR